MSNATLALGGTFSAGLLSALGSLSLSAGTTAAGQLQILGTADNTGGTLSLGAGSHFGALLGPVSLAGTILNGTVLDAGNGLGFSTGTGVLDGVTYAGTLNLAPANSGLTLTDNSHVTSSAGGAGSIIDTGTGSMLLLRGTETLDNTAILLGSNGPTAASIGTSDTWLASSGTTATLGPHCTVTQSGACAALQANGWSPLPGFGVSDTLVNQGSISGAVAGGLLALSGYGTIVNQGVMTVTGGDTLAVSVAQFANAGTIVAGQGGTVVLGQAPGLFGTAPGWSNAGQIAVNGGTLVLAGSFSAGQLGTITETAGLIQLAGTLSNSGATLALGTHAGPLSLSAMALSGTVLGGTIADASGLLSFGSTGSALLDGVAYQGTLALTQAGTFLRIRDGLALTGVADVLGSASMLDFQGSQTIDHAQIMLGASGTAATLGLLHDPASSGANTLVLGGALSVVQSGALATIGGTGELAGDSIVNAGKITAGVFGGTLTLGGAGFTNQGRIAVSNGDTLAITAGSFSNTGSIAVSNAVVSLAGSMTLAGLGQISLSAGILSVSGTLDLGGGTLQIGAGTPLGRISLTGTLRNGTIADAGAGLACNGSATLDGITYAGVLDLSRPFAQLAVADGLTLAAQAGKPGSILLTGAQSRLIATTSETIDNAAIQLGSVAQYYAGQRLAQPELAGTPGVQLRLGAGASIALSGTAGMLGDAALSQWNDSIVNAGQISAATLAGTLTLGGTFFTNTGVMSASAGGILLIDDVGFTNSGVLSIGTGSAVQVMLYNYYAAPVAGPNVFTNTGTISMQGGIFQELTANGLFPAVPLANLAGGAIQGNGMIFAQIANAGTIEAKGGSLLLVQPVLGAGGMLIDPGATLEIGAAQPAGQVVRFASTGGTLKLDQPSLFAGAISGFVAGNVIDLPGQVLTGVGINSGTLVASTATQNFRLLTTTPLGGALSAGHDAHGGATISITPQSVGGGGNSGSAAALLPVGQPGMLFWASPAGDVFQGSSANIAGAHISNWSPSDSIDITDMSPATAKLSAVLSPNLDTLTIADGTHSTSVGLTGTFVASAFHLSTDGQGGTILTYGHS